MREAFTRIYSMELSGILRGLCRFGKRAMLWTILLSSLPLLLPSVSIASFIGFAILFHVGCGALGLAFLRGLLSTYCTCNSFSSSSSKMLPSKIRALILPMDNLRVPPNFDAYLIIKETKGAISSQESYESGLVVDSTSPHSKKHLEVSKLEGGLSRRTGASVLDRNQKEEFADLIDSGYEELGKEDGADQEEEEEGQEHAGHILDPTEESKFEEVLKAEFDGQEEAEEVVEWPSPTTESTSKDSDFACVDTAAEHMQRIREVSHFVAEENSEGSGQADLGNTPNSSSSVRGSQESDMGLSSSSRIRTVTRCPIGEVEAKECMKVVEFCLSQTEDYEYLSGSDELLEEEEEAVPSDDVLQEVISLRGEQHGEFLFPSSPSNEADCSSKTDNEFSEASTSSQGLSSRSSAYSMSTTPASVGRDSMFFSRDSSGGNGGGGGSSVSSKSSSVGDNMSTSCLQRRLFGVGLGTTLEQHMKALRSSPSDVRIDDLLSCSSSSQDEDEDASQSQFARLLRFWRQKEREVQISKKNLFESPLHAAR